MTVQNLNAEAYIDFIRTYASDPVGFVVNVLKADPLPWQRDFLGKIARGDRRISVRAGHGVGKSTACSWALIWHMTCRYPQKGVVTAPTAAQLFDALFAELKSWINKLPPVLRESFEVFSDKIVLKGAPESSFISARTSSAERPEALAGVHSEHVLLVVDEASAVPEAVFEAAAGSMSGHSATTILISNPTRSSGLFYKTHHELASDWNRMHVSCLANPLVSTDFVRQIAATYGEASNAFRIRVLGEFALGDDDTLIPAELVDAAFDRDITAPMSEPMVYGLDVARFGSDRTALCKRRGNVVVELKSWGGLDLMQTVGAVVNEAKMDAPDEICVDTIGLGSGVADRLREQGYNVRDVNVSESSAMNPNANRLRDELWISVKDWLGTRAVKLPRDESLRHELVAPRYTFSSSGKLVVESKDGMRKRGMRSPDLADSLCFVGSTLIQTPTGERTIEDLQVGDLVTTPFGATRVAVKWISETRSLTTANFSNGKSLQGKGEHKIFVWGQGACRLDALTLTMDIEPYSKWRLFLWKLLTLFSTEAKNFGFKPLVDIINQEKKLTVSAFCTAAFMLSIMAASRNVLTFITKIMTGGTTISPILNASHHLTTEDSTCLNVTSQKNIGEKLQNGWARQGFQLPNGTKVKREGSGIVMPQENHGNKKSKLSSTAKSANLSLEHISLKKHCSVHQPAVNPHGFGHILQILERAIIVAASSWQTAIGKRRIVLDSVQTEPVPPTKVYNLTLEDHNVYYANGVLAYNCLTFAGTAAGVGGRAFAWRPGKPLRRGISGIV